MPDKKSLLWQSCGAENEVTIQLPHIRLAARVWGSDDKPLLLALHGWLDNANSFAPLTQYLDNFQVLAIDWPGHGRSQHRPGAYPLHWIDYLYDVDILLDAVMAIKPVYAVIGHSLGAIVTSAYSAAFADKVPHWILIEAMAPLFEAPANSRRRLVRSFQGYRRLLTRKSAPSRSFTLESAVTARHRLTGLATPWCRLIIERNVNDDEALMRWRTDPRLTLDSPMRLNLEHLTGLMQGHTGHVLLITARDGYQREPEIAQQVLDWYEAITHVELDGDHHLHMGNAQQVAKHICEFLS